MVTNSLRFASLFSRSGRSIESLCDCDAPCYTMFCARRLLLTAATDLLSRHSLRIKEAWNYTTSTLFVLSILSCVHGPWLSHRTSVSPHQQAGCNPTRSIAGYDSILTIHHCRHARCASRVQLIYLSRENRIICSWFPANPAERKIRWGRVVMAKNYIKCARAFYATD